MREAVKVDARGLSCPEPVMLAKQAMDRRDATRIEVLVDSATSRDNVRRAAEHLGWTVNIYELDAGGFRLDLTR